MKTLNFEKDNGSKAYDNNHYKVNTRNDLCRHTYRECMGKVYECVWLLFVVEL
jgi:hypothetical protein